MSFYTVPHTLKAKFLANAEKVLKGYPCEYCISEISDHTNDKTTILRVNITGKFTKVELGRIGRALSTYR